MSIYTGFDAIRDMRNRMQTVTATIEWHWYCPKCERSCLSSYNPQDKEWRLHCSDCMTFYAVKAAEHNAQRTSFGSSWNVRLANLIIRLGWWFAEIGSR